MNADKIMKTLVALLVLPYTIVLNAFLFVQLWSWFIVPTFDFEPLFLGQGAGLSLFVAYLTSHLKRDEQENLKGTGWDAVAWLYLRPTMIAGFFILASVLYLNLFTSI